MEFKQLVDLHCHILPGIDDGSPDIEHSLQLARDAVVDGVSYILATPHHLDKNYVNHPDEVSRKVKSFQKILDEENIPLKIFPGQEVHINGDLLDRFDDLLGVDTKKKYMLLELPHGDVPGYTKKLIFELRKAGTIPVIVHPERNKKIQDDLDILYDFIQMGSLAQLTATSYIGGFGEHVKDISKKLIEHNLVQIIASDAHALNGREFELREALEKIEIDFGEEKAELFARNAKRMINGQRVILQEFSPVPRKKHLLKFW